MEAIVAIQELFDFFRVHIVADDGTLTAVYQGFNPVKPRCQGLQGCLIGLNARLCFLLAIKFGACNLNETHIAPFREVNVLSQYSDGAIRRGFAFIVQASG